MNSILHQLKRHNLVWQGKVTETEKSCWSSGFNELDELLHGGWPEHGVVGIRSPMGIGELRMLLPALQQRQHQQQRLLVLINPPARINGETLAALGFELSQIMIICPDTPDLALWSAEQCLKSGCCYAALNWQNNLQVHQIKRLQLAAQQGKAVQFIFSQHQQSQGALPLHLQLTLQPNEQGIEVKVNRHRGYSAGGLIRLNMRHLWPQLCRPQTAENVIRLHKRKAG